MKGPVFQVFRGGVADACIGMAEIGMITRLWRRQEVEVIFVIVTGGPKIPDVAALQFEAHADVLSTKGWNAAPSNNQPRPD
jgi:hypothetical protein